MMKSILMVPFVTVLLTSPFSVNPILAGQEQAESTEHEQLLSLYFDETQMVEAATRVAKPMNQVAENVTIVTAEQIERMNAHNVDEVLNRVPGVFVLFNGQDFNGVAATTIHASQSEHVLILVDGIRWNDAYGGYAKTYNIPIEIISRIEVIKGPASSTWGSSLGGVINIITKKTGTTARPTGKLSGSYGEADSSEINGEVAGKAGPAGYFLAASSQNSDGLMGNRFWQRDSIYGKMSLDLPHSSTLSFSSGYNEPEFRSFDSYELGFRAEGKDRNFWLGAILDSRLGDNLGLNLSIFRKEEKFLRPYYTLPDENFWFQTENNLWNNGISALLNGEFSNHKVVLGVEYERSEADSDSEVNHDETWGLYINDTISLGSFTLTPGIRYDSLPLIDESQVSPSLGLTWQYNDNTLLRGVVARGFRRPYLSDGASNPDLDPEVITSYQFGLESSTFALGLIKASIFEHLLQDRWFWSEKTDYVTKNGSDAKRYGYEMELESHAWHNLAAQASFTYVYTDYDEELEDDDQYSGKLTILYDNPDIITAELFGIYTWWNTNNVNKNGEYDTIIWDLSLSKKVRISEDTSITLFTTAHNLFDGCYYWDPIFENPHRWVEAGLRFYF